MLQENHFAKWSLHFSSPISSNHPSSLIASCGSLKNPPFDKNPRLPRRSFASRPSTSEAAAGHLPPSPWRLTGPSRAAPSVSTAAAVRHGVKRMSATPKKDGRGWFFAIVLAEFDCLSWFLLWCYTVSICKYVIAIFGVRASQLALVCKYHREWGAKTISAFNDDIYQTAISLGWYYTSSFYSILVWC